jgi:hypothetical protein
MKTNRFSQTLIPFYEHPDSIIADRFFGFGSDVCEHRNRSEPVSDNDRKGSAGSS